MEIHRIKICVNTHPPSFEDFNMCNILLDIFIVMSFGIRKVSKHTEGRPLICTALHFKPLISMRLISHIPQHSFYRKIVMHFAILKLALKLLMSECFGLKCNFTYCKGKQ
jgi:hypothetical protein